VISDKSKDFFTLLKLAFRVGWASFPVSHDEYHGRITGAARQDGGQE
jgi:hypothetical protein